MPQPRIAGHGAAWNLTLHRLKLARFALHFKSDPDRRGRGLHPVVVVHRWRCRPTRRFWSSFVNIRETGGWSKDAAQAIAALLAPALPAAVNPCRP
jgi:hypothetical protein